jgi:hypothetical protein
MRPKIGCGILQSHRMQKQLHFHFMATFGQCLQLAATQNWSLLIRVMRNLPFGHKTEKTSFSPQIGMEILIYLSFHRSAEKPTA